MSTICLKVILLGNSRVGKSSIKTVFAQEKFTSTYQPTVGADVQTNRIKVNNFDVQVQMCDLCGNDQFKSMAKHYYEGMDGCILVFDLTNPQSEFGVSQWMEDFLQHAKPKDNFPFLVLGNKLDLVANPVRSLMMKRDVNRIRNRDIRNWCIGKKVPYLEVSAKENIGIRDAFEDLAKACIQSEEEYEFL